MQRKLCRTNVNVILWEIKQGNFFFCRQLLLLEIILGWGFKKLKWRISAF